MLLEFSLDHQHIERTDRNKVVAQSKDYLFAKFTDVGGDWHGPITALFDNYTVLLDDDMTCKVPWEVLAKAGSFTVSAFCDDLHTADVANVRVSPSGYVKGQTPRPPTQSVYNQLVCLTEDTKAIAQSVRDDANAGKFTPVKGTDYWTEADKAAIQSDVTAATQPAVDATATATNAANAANNAAVSAYSAMTQALDAADAAKGAKTDALNAAAKARSVVVPAQSAANAATAAADAATIAATSVDAAVLNANEMANKAHQAANTATSAADAATIAVGNVEGIIADANTSISNANTAADEARSAAQKAVIAESKANASATKAKDAAAAANATVKPANDAANEAIIATRNANAATRAANIATDKANRLTDNQPKHTATGELIALDDVYAAQPLSLTVEGKTVKDEAGLTCVESATINVSSEAQSNPIQLPINLQSNKLCSLPNGVHDELRVTREVERGHVELVKNVDLKPAIPTSEPIYTAIVSASTAPSGESFFDVGFDVAYFETDTTEKNNQYIFAGTKVFAVKDAYVNTGECAWIRQENGKIFLRLRVDGLSTVQDYIDFLANTKPMAILPSLVMNAVDLGYIDLPTLPSPKAMIWTSSNFPAVTSSVEYIQDLDMLEDKTGTALNEATADHDELREMINKVVAHEILNRRIPIPADTFTADNRGETFFVCNEDGSKGYMKLSVLSDSSSISSEPYVLNDAPIIPFGRDITFYYPTQDIIWIYFPANAPIQILFANKLAAHLYFPWDTGITNGVQALPMLDSDYLQLENMQEGVPSESMAIPSHKQDVACNSIPKKKAK